MTTGGETMRAIVLTGRGGMDRPVAVHGG